MCSLVFISKNICCFIYVDKKDFNINKNTIGVGRKINKKFIWRFHRCFTKGINL